MRGLLVEQPGEDVPEDGDDVVADQQGKLPP
jgi:hypothetical protein